MSLSTPLPFPSSVSEIAVQAADASGTGPKGPQAAVRAAPTVALATSWAPTDVHSADEYLDALGRLGAQALVVVAGDSIPADLPSLSLALGRRRHELPVLAVEGLLGALSLSAPQAGQTRLCAIDREEADTAIRVVRAAMDLATQLGAKTVIVSLGSVGERGDGIERLWRQLVARWRRGVLLYEPASAQALREVRAALATHHLDAAMRSLDRLLEEASRRDLGLCLRSPARGLELPAALELATLRSVFAGAPLSALLDLPAAHLASSLQLLPLRDTVLAYAAADPATGSQPLTQPWANLADACGPIAGLVPGQGEAQPSAVARALPSQAQRLFVPWPQLLPIEVRRGLVAVSRL